MRVDAFTHFFPKEFFDRLDDIAPDWKDMGKRSKSIAALHDLDLATVAALRQATVTDHRSQVARDGMLERLGVSIEQYESGGKG